MVTPWVPFGAGMPETFSKWEYRREVESTGSDIFPFWAIAKPILGIVIFGMPRTIIFSPVTSYIGISDKKIRVVAVVLTGDRLCFLYYRR